MKQKTPQSPPSPPHTPGTTLLVEFPLVTCEDVVSNANTGALFPFSHNNPPMSPGNMWKYLTPAIVRLVLLIFASSSIGVCCLSDTSLAHWVIADGTDPYIGTVNIGVFNTEITLSKRLDQSLLGFLDYVEKNGMVCDAKPLARAMEAFVVMSAVATSLAMFSAVPSRNIRLLNVSIALGVVASVFQSVAIALWVAFRHTKCTSGGTIQPLFQADSDTDGIVQMSISLVCIIASVPLGLYSRTVHKEAFSYVSIQ